MANYDFTGLMDDTEKTATGKYDFSGLMDEKVDTKKTRKPAWDISSVDELMAKGFSPTQAGLLATGQQLSSPAWKYGNMMLGGLPNKALQGMGYEAPEARIKAGFDKEGKDITGLVDTAANIGGFVRGLPMKAGAALAGKIGVGGIGGAALRGATRYGTASALQTPAREAFSNWQSRGLRGAGAAAGGAVIGTAGQLVSNFTKLLSDKSQIATGKGTREGFNKFKQNLTGWFGKRITQLQERNPGKSVDINNELSAFKATLEDNRKFKTLLNTSPKLKKALESQGKLTLQKTQDLINQIKENISDANWGGRGVKPSTREVMGFVDSLKAARNKAFPQFGNIDNVYSKMKDYSKAAQKIMEYGKTTKGFNKMLSDPENKKALQMVLPKETYEQITNIVNYGGLKKHGLRAAETLIRYGIIYKFMRDMLGRTSGESSEITQG